MNRTQTVLLGLLLLQVLLIGIFRGPFSETSARTEARALLPGLDAISPARLQIDGGDDEQVTLVRRNEDWTIEELGGFPADNDKVERLLENLEGIQVRRPVVTHSSYHKAFKVASDDYEERLRIWKAGEEDPSVDLILGSSANYRTTHARLADEDEVYEIQGIAPYDVRPSSGAWIRKDLADDLGEVDRLVLRNAKGEFELRLLDGTWTVASPADRADEALDQEEVSALLRLVTGLRLADGVGPLDETAQGFTEPAAMLELSWIPGTPGDEDAGRVDWTLRVGAKVADQETQRYVTSSSLPFTGAIWESSVDRLLEDSLDDLRAEADSG